MSDKLIKINAIVAMCNSNNGIGINGTLPWKIAKDLKFFAQITKFTKDKSKMNAVILGRKTWFSLPAVYRPLPNRINIIISNTINDKKDLQANTKANLNDIHICHSYSDAIELVNTTALANQIESIYVIGGAQIYKSAFEYKYFNRLYLTRVFLDFVCDTFLEPANFLDSFNKITEIDKNGVDENLNGYDVNTIEKEAGIEFCFEIYERKF